MQKIFLSVLIKTIRLHYLALKILHKVDFGLGNGSLVGPQQKPWLKTEEIDIKDKSLMSSTLVKGGV